MKFILPALPVFALLFAPDVGYSQSCCGRVALPAAGVHQRPLLEGQFDFRLAYEDLLLDRNLLESVEVSDLLDRQNRTRVISGSFSYGLTQRLTGTVVVPFKWTELSLLDGEIVRKTSGLGDILGMAKFRITAPVSPREAEFAAGFGVKIPTGKYADRDYFGTLSSSQQVGSGAIDFIVAAYYNRGFGKMTLQTGSFFRYPTRNNRGYKFGNEFEFTGSIIFDGLVNRIEPLMGFRFRSAARDSYHGSPADSYGGGAYRDSGGDWAFFTTGVYIRPHKQFGFLSEIELPVYAGVNGLQISEGFTWRITTTFSGQ